jgi:TonB family protein
MGYPASQRTVFSLLPKTRTPWREFVFSSGMQACAVAFLLWLRLLYPAVLSSPARNLLSVRVVNTPAPVNHQPQPLRPLAKPVYTASLNTSATLHLPSPQPHAKVVEDSLAPSVRIAAKEPAPIQVNSAPVLPKVVAVNLFSTGSSATPTTTHAPEHVQTGGFGDPNGVPAKENSGKPANLGALGSFDLPSGGGYGNGGGGTQGKRGVVASSGFGNGTATGDGTTSGGPARAVQAGGFGDADVAAPATMRSHTDVVSVPLLPAVIISKPTPIYTAEARELRIQGEVLLEVILQASGSLRVVRVVRGLGHGLDNNAMKAAEQIRFKPATRNGQPADSTVVLHIIFQLA